MNVIINHSIINENEFEWTAPKRCSHAVSFSLSEWFILQVLYGPTFSSMSPFGPYCCFFFLPVAKHYQSAFFFSLNLFRKHADANYESFCKNLTLSTCLLSFVCDSILHSKNFQNISIFFFGRGGGGLFLGYKYTKTDKH